jgi:hypothetical protein
MALDPHGAFQNAPDSFGGSFSRITPPGARPVIILSSDYPCALGADHTLFYADTRPPTRLMKLTAVRNGSTFSQQELKSPGQTSPPLNAITGIAVGPGGVIYLSQSEPPSGNSSILTVAPQGRTSMLLTNFTRMVAPGATNHSIRGLVIDSSTNIFVAATGLRSVLKITPDKKVTTLLRADPPWAPTAVAFSRQDLYILEYTDAPPDADPNDRTAWVPRVRKVTPHGTISIVAAVRR